MYHQEEAKFGILNAGIVTVFMGVIVILFQQTNLNKHSEKKKAI